VHVAEQPTETAEQDEVQLPPAQKVLHALAVRVPHELEDDVDEKDVVRDGSLVGVFEGLSLLEGVGSFGFDVGFGGASGGLGVGILSGPMTIGGRLGG